MAAPLTPLRGPWLKAAIQRPPGVSRTSDTIPQRHLLHMMGPTIAAAFSLYAGLDPHVVNAQIAPDQVVGPRIGQPLLNSALAFKPSTKVESEAYEVRSPVPSRILSPSFQTVGQPLLGPLGFKASLQLDQEQDQARRTAPSYPGFSVSTVISLPLLMMQTVSLRLEAEPQQIIVSGPTIHAFRVGYQTVGLPYALLHKSSVRADAETYEVRSPVPTLHAFRPGFATVGQPLFAMQVGKRGEMEPEQARISSAPTIHSFRPGFQTVGQPLGMRSSPRATRIEVEQDSVARKAQSYPASNLVVSAGMPLPLLALRTPRNHALYDAPQFQGATNRTDVYQQAQVAPPPPYQPLVRMQRLPMAWVLHEPTVFCGATARWERVNTPTTVVDVAVYDFQFISGVYDVPDFNAIEWHEQVRYHTNHARLMQAFRQYGAFTVTTKEFDLSATGEATYCVEVENFTEEPGSGPATWTPDTDGTDAWAPPAAPSGTWSPPSTPSGTWTDDTPPSTTWTTKQKTC